MKKRTKILCIILVVSFLLSPIQISAEIKESLESTVSVESATPNVFGGGSQCWFNYGTQHFLTRNSDNVLQSGVYKASSHSKFEWIFTYVDSTYFTISPSTDLGIYLTIQTPEPLNAEITEVEFTTAIDTPTIASLWRIVPDTKNSYTGYRIQSKAHSNYDLYAMDNGNVKAAYNVNPAYEHHKIWVNYSASITSSSTLSNFSYTCSSYMNVSTTQTISLHSFFPSNAPLTDTDYFSFRSSDESVAIIDKTGKITSNSTGVTTIFIEHRPTNTIKYFVLTVGNAFPSGYYYIINKATQEFLTMEGKASNASARLLTDVWSNANDTVWYFASCGNGQYYITSAHSGYYVGAEPSNGSISAPAYQYPDIAHDVYLSIRATTSNAQDNNGAYKIYTSNGNAYNGALSAATTNYHYVYQKPYTDDADYSDEWVIIPVSDITTFSTEIGIVENAYHYITNCSTRNRLSLTASGTQMLAITEEMDDSDVQLWKFGTLNSDNKCAIYSKNNTGEQVLSVTNSSAIYVRNYNGQAYNQKFTVYRVNIWPYEGSYLIMYNGGYLTENGQNGVYISTTITEHSFWTITQDTNYGATLYCFNYPDYNSSGTSDTFRSLMQSLGFNTRVAINSTPSVMYNHLNGPSSQFFVYRGHGAPGYLQFYNSLGAVVGNLNAVRPENDTSSGIYISDIEDNGLAGVQCVMLMGCSTGLKNQNGDSFLDIFYEKGVQFVLGTFDTTGLTSSDAFFVEFLNELNQGTTIEDALLEAKDLENKATLYSYGTTGDYPILYRGNTKLYYKMEVTS